MRHRPAARHPVGSLVLVLSALLVSPSSALAMTWGPVRELGPVSGETTRPVIVGTGLNRAVAAFVSRPSEVWDDPPPFGVWVVRTGDSGATWSEPMLVDGNQGSEPRLTAYGPRVDLVWVQAGRVNYRRSADGGRTWVTRRTLSPPGVQAVAADVARSSAGQVTVAWAVSGSGELRVRTSLDGGATFQPSRRVRATAPSGTPLGARLSTASGVTHVAFFISPSRIATRRSDDAGGTWQMARIVARDALAYGLDLASAAGVVVLAYAHQEASTERAVFRRSPDNAVSWGPAVPLSLTAEEWSGSPTIDARGGTWMAMWSRDVSGPSAFVELAAMHRSSTDGGRTWSAPSRVGPVPTSYGFFEYEYPGEATLAGKQIVVFRVFHDGGVGVHGAFVRAEE